MVYLGAIESDSSLDGLQSDDEFLPLAQPSPEYRTTTAAAEDAEPDIEEDVSGVGMQSPHAAARSHFNATADKALIAEVLSIKPFSLVEAL